MLAHIRQYKPWSGVMQLRRKDGVSRWVFLSIAPILDEEGQPLRFVVVMDDVTQQKQLEEALRQARDEALEANRLKTSLLAHVSHDMRTPLGGILGFTEMMLAEALGPLSDKQREALQRILESTQTLVDFTNDLINQAELESGRLRLKPEPFAPADLLKVLPSYVGLAEAKGVKVNTFVDPDLPDQVVGDLYWIRRILANLLSNATKFTDKGEVVVLTASGTGGMEALALLDEATAVDLVVSDIVMPQMGGLELYQHIQERQDTVQILFITGHPLEDQNQQLLQQGKIHWLQKPFTIQQFNQVVLDLLG
jgi:signal transduction histidine kinase